MAELLSKAKDQVVEALSQATAAVSLGGSSGPFSLSSNPELQRVRVHHSARAV